MKTIFSSVPVGSEFFAYWNPNDPLECDTFKATKTGKNSATAKGQFDNLNMADNEPVIFKGGKV